jgi:hypothetical protein
MEDSQSELEIAKAAYETLKVTAPKKLHLIYLLLAEGETPEEIFSRMEIARPGHTDFSVICAGAAYWIVHQKNSN